MQFTDFRDRPLVFVDLEMTGLDPTEHEIIEIGALVVDQKTFEITKEYETKVIPEHIETADPEALRINGYKPENWKGAKPLGTAIEEFNNLAPGAMIVGWNMSLDWIFLALSYKKVGIKRSYDYHAIDILPLAWVEALKNGEAHPRTPGAPATGGQVKQIKLSEFYDRYVGGERAGKHQAMADIKATYELFRKLIEKRS